MDKKEYIDRACCEIGGTTPSDMCPVTSTPDNDGKTEHAESISTIDTATEPNSEELSVGPETNSSASTDASEGSGTNNTVIIILAVCLSIAVVGLALGLLLFMRRRRSNPSANGSGNADNKAPNINSGSNENNQTEVDVEMLLRHDSSINPDMPAVPPPEAAPSAPPATNPAFDSGK